MTFFGEMRQSNRKKYLNILLILSTRVLCFYLTRTLISSVRFRIDITSFQRGYRGAPLSYRQIRENWVPHGYTNPMLVILTDKKAVYSPAPLKAAIPHRPPPPPMTQMTLVTMLGEAGRFRHSVSAVTQVSRSRRNRHDRQHRHAAPKAPAGQPPFYDTRK